MEFNVNHPVIYVLVSICVLFVLAQSVFFLVRALKRGKEMGIDKSKLLKAVKTAAIFTIAPAISIVICVITLSKKLGVPLPWLRLSVIGSLTYETTAAEAAASALGTSLSESAKALTAQEYVTIALVMTTGIFIGVILVPLLTKKLQSGMLKYKQKDKAWGEILTTALFMGMISAFLGLVFADVTTGLKGWIPVFVMIISALCIALCAVIMKITKWKWISDYALPISMIIGMASAIPLTSWIV